MIADEAGYRDFVAHRLATLRGFAYLLCGDWHTADDLVSVALLKLLRHWRRVSTMDHPDAYVRRILLRAWLDERRRPWRKERATDELLDGAADAPDPTVRLTILAQLAELPPRRRAVIVLRYYCDMSVDEVAQVLNCSAGTVKSQTARALETLRFRLTEAPVELDIHNGRLEDHART